MVEQSCEQVHKIANSILSVLKTEVSSTGNTQRDPTQDLSLHTTMNQLAQN